MVNWHGFSNVATSVSDMNHDVESVPVYNGTPDELGEKLNI